MTACDTTTMIRMGDPWAGLDDFHRAMLDFIAEVDEHEGIARGLEGERSIAREAALFQSVSSRLAAAVERGIGPAVDPSGDALLTACRAVGQYMGIDVRASQQGRGRRPRALPSDPLGDLARAGGFQVAARDAARGLVAAPGERSPVGTPERRGASARGPRAGPISQGPLRASLPAP